MRWLILNRTGDITFTNSYNDSVRIAYCLNANVVSVGIGNSIFNVDVLKEHLPLLPKMDMLLRLSRNKKEYEEINEGVQHIKNYPKIKNKKAPDIVFYNVAKKKLSDIFDIEIDMLIEKTNQIYGTKTLKHLFNSDCFYSYHGDENTTFFEPEPDSPEGKLLYETVLELDLPDPENGAPLFFLCMNKMDDTTKTPFDVHPSNSKKAEKLDAIYADKSCKFSFMTTLNENELQICREDLTLPTAEFRQKIEQWAQICYDNPNSNKGLNFFRKNIKDWLPSTENLVQESKVIKNNNELIRPPVNAQISFGEMPIAQIWKLMLDSKIILEDVYNNLMKKKEEQKPKFDGRWPVVIYNFTDFAKIDEVLENNENQQVVSVRKTISLD